MKKNVHHQEHGRFENEKYSLEVVFDYGDKDADGT